MRVRIKDLKGFNSSVFGADSFLEYWPEILTTGVDVKKHEGFYYILIKGKMSNNTAFFSKEEMKYFEEIL